MAEVHGFQLSPKAKLFPYAVGTIKKHATGSGNAKKPAMVEAARLRWSVDVTDHNHADALCVLALHLEKKWPKQ
jgi:Holliday junction resolvasome RuvABC endonuclease subunit